MHTLATPRALYVVMAPSASQRQGCINLRPGGADAARQAQRCRARRDNLPDHRRDFQGIGMRAHVYVEMGMACVDMCV